MAKITDKLTTPRLRKAVRGDVPEWWPAAQIAGAAVIGIGFLVASLAHFGNSDSSAPATSTGFSEITAAPITAAPATTPGGTTAPTVPGTTPGGANPPSTAPAAPGSMPTPVDAATVAVALDGTDGTRAIPLAAWLAARDNVQLVYPNSEKTAVKLTQSSGTAHTFSITISNGEDTFDVPVTAVLQSNGVWAAS